MFLDRSLTCWWLRRLSDGWWPGIKLRKSSPLQVFSGQCFVNPTERRTRTHVCCLIHSYISNELGFRHSWSHVSMLTKVILFWSPCFVCLLRSVFPGCTVLALLPFTSLKGIILCLLLSLAKSSCHCVEGLLLYPWCLCDPDCATRSPQGAPMSFCKDQPCSLNISERFGITVFRDHLLLSLLSSY